MKFDQCQICTIFLEVTKKEIKAYGKQHHIMWVEDPTNINLAIRRNNIRHQLDDISRSPVFPGLLVVFLVKFAYQLFKERTHGMIIKTGEPYRPIVVQYIIWGEVNVRRGQLFNKSTQRVSLNQLASACDLVAEFKIVEDVLDVLRKPIEVGCKILL